MLDSRYKRKTMIQNGCFLKWGTSIRPSHETILVLKPIGTYCDLRIPHDLRNYPYGKNKLHISLMRLENS